MLKALKTPKEKTPEMVFIELLSEKLFAKIKLTI